ncbi:hypothetical protein [Frankia sp. Cppng1_Ct_nod]|uniref:hypothetical protein n=1 Tax=Frankia sp. Cppng1_Ct_nod TaxID=2897162 RepID=UPI0013EF9325|nr:hypothetical protein [Frankia sp. Cppng1_Ct_nod]
MIVLSGVLVLVSAVLLLMGVAGGTGFIYAAIITSLVAAVLLPLGVHRRSRRPPQNRS